jgi:hypothetical protein
MRAPQRTANQTTDVRHPDSSSDAYASRVIHAVEGCSVLVRTALRPSDSGPRTRTSARRAFGPRTSDLGTAPLL